MFIKTTKLNISKGILGFYIVWSATFDISESKVLLSKRAIWFHIVI